MNLWNTFIRFSVTAKTSKPDSIRIGQYFASLLSGSCFLVLNRGWVSCLCEGRPHFLCSPWQVRLIQKIRWSASTHRADREKWRVSPQYIKVLDSITSYFLIPFCFLISKWLNHYISSPVKLFLLTMPLCLYFYHYPPFNVFRLYFFWFVYMNPPGAVVEYSVDYLFIYLCYLILLKSL